MASSALIYQIGYGPGMKRLCATVALLVATAGVALADGREWAVSPPAGWHENPGLAAQVREPAGEDMVVSESAAWQSPDGRADSLILQWMVLKDGGDRRYLDTYDRDFRSGLIDELGRGLQLDDRPERIVDGGIIRDSVFTTPELRVRAVRHYRPARDGLHVLLMSCSSEPSTSPCDAAIDNARFATAGGSPGGGHDVLRGVAIGGLLVVLAGLAWRASRFRR